MKKFIYFWKEIANSWWGAVAFYTIIPLPQQWSLQLTRIARFAPLIGILLGGILAVFDQTLSIINVPILTRSALVVAVGILLTGGLHLDGVIDTADGLAVLDSEKRLQVMKDSTTGAFGVIAAVIVLILKIVAFSEITQVRWLILILMSGWGRWGQVSAIALYPYLRAEGKGDFHKEALKLPQDLLLGGITLGLITLIGLIYWQWDVIIPLFLGMAIPLLVGWWFNRQLGGQTGDTYGAVVEWSEALYLCVLTTL
ncbi:MAG: adenosylcobinamide-GDP ribazoletransferase [Halothece sp.]